MYWVELRYVGLKPDIIARMELLEGLIAIRYFGNLIKKKFTRFLASAATRQDWTTSQLEKNRPQNNCRWNTHSWNTSQLEKMLELTPIKKVPLVSC